MAKADYPWTIPVKPCLTPFSRRTCILQPHFFFLPAFSSSISLHAVNPARILPHPADSANIAQFTLHDAIFLILRPLSAHVQPRCIAGLNAKVLSDKVC